jgi:hypothetical protein
MAAVAMTPRVAGVVGRALLLMGSLAVTLVAAEVAFRIAAAQPVFAWTNFRERMLNRQGLELAAYHPDLGWTLRPELTTTQLRTLAHGIRRNGPYDTALRHDGVLAVGDSFTAGAQVHDHETWPAELERLIGRPVLNAGTGGYGTDQIVMRAESLLPIVRPQVLLVGFLSQDIQRSGYSVFGRPKPYYTVKDGRLVLHQSPVPRQSGTDGPAAAAERFASHSFAIHRIMSTFAPDAWLFEGPRTLARIANDPVEVTCRLLQRLKLRTDAFGIRTVLVMQYGGGAIQNWTAPSDDAVQVTACAQAMGIQLVDEFDSLKAVYRASPQELRSYYVMADDSYGHMSARGNRHIAALVADALAGPPVTGRPQDYAPEQPQPGDGVNLVARSEALTRALAGASFASFARSGRPIGGQQVYRLAASGGRSEHHAALLPVRTDAGAYAASLYAKADGVATCLRVQLFDREANGVLADFDLQKATALVQPIGAASGRRAGVTAGEEGWLRLWLSARLRVDGAQLLLQLADRSCNAAFEPNGEAVLVRAVQLERGQSASAYRPSSGPGSPGFVAGDGRNRIARAEELEAVIGQSVIAALSPIAQDPARTYRLEATGPVGEHYLGIENIPAEAGPYTLALEARAAGTARLRLQILDDTNNGAIGDFDLAADAATTIALGASQGGDVDIEIATDAWRRLTLTTPLAGQHARILLQVMDRDGRSSFEPAGEAVELRLLRLEHGHAR